MPQYRMQEKTRTIYFVQESWHSQCKARIDRTLTDRLKDIRLEYNFDDNRAFLKDIAGCRQRHTAKDCQRKATCTLDQPIHQND